MNDEDAQRLLSAAARALERVQVADDPSGAADEAEAILSKVVTLDGKYVPAPSTILEILRVHGPLTLRDLTAAMSTAQGGRSLMYDDVDSVMHRHRKQGLAECEPNLGDYRENVWSATPQ